MACLLLAAVLLAGCWDQRQIEDTAYVVSMGVDTAGDEYLWTFRIAVTEELAVGMLTTPGAPTGGLASSLLTARGSNLEQAVQLIQASVMRIVVLDNMRAVAFGEEAARRGLLPVLNQLRRHPELRTTTVAAVAKGRAADVFLANQPTADVNPVKFMEGIYLVQKRVHLGPPMRLQHFLTRLQASGVDPLLSLVAVNEQAQQPPGSPLPPMGDRSLEAGEFPRAGGNPIEAAGSAAFRGDRLAGFLTVDETSALLALRGEMGKVYGTLPDPHEAGKVITFRFHQENKPQYRTALEGGRPAVRVKLQLEGEILSITGETDYSAPVNRRKLEEYVATYSRDQVYAPLIRKVYQEWGADPVGIGNLFRTRFPTLDAWLDFGWEERVREVEISVEIQFFIRRFGLLLGGERR